jgi:hypothetical protein
VVLINNDSYTSEGTTKRISFKKPAMTNLTKTIKDLEVSTNTKVMFL